MEQNSIKGIPYGLTDYTRLARENYYYVDKTHFIPLIEQFASYLFLIRPPPVRQDAAHQHAGGLL